jgi:hypothetical protein
MSPVSDAGTGDGQLMTVSVNPEEEEKPQ